MSASVSSPEHWQSVGRPPSFFRRFQFSGYAETRAFLDRLGALSEATGYYPDISFGTNYANVTVHARDGKALAAVDADFAQQVSALAAGNTPG